MHCYNLPLSFLSPPFRRPKTLTLTPLKSAFSSAPSTYGPDELPPPDEAFLAQFALRDKPSEDVARRENWVLRGWAPWEEILTPEAAFARTSLNEGFEVPLQNPDAIAAFKMLTPSHRKKVVEESGLSEAEFLLKRFGMKGEVPERLETRWDGVVAVRMVPPRDWPPRGWEVDGEELEFIREAHGMEAERVDLEEEGSGDKEGVCVDRYRVWLKQYKEWAAANKDRLEEESYKFDQDYFAGRRKRGKDYKDDMFELPFIYPGQICVGKVKSLHLYQGAFVDIGCVHDGWVPIKGNDWYWIRHHIKVGMQVIVEVLAKRDPYRFRFPIEIRFVDPNIDHLIFNRFDFPPIFHRAEDTNVEELWRVSGRPPIPRKRPPVKVEEQSLLSNHPYVNKIWQLHNAEQMILDHEDENPEKYKDKKYIETVSGTFDEQNSVEYTQAYFKKALLPKMILNTNISELDLDAARAERQLNNKLKKEAEARGEVFKIDKLRRNIEMDEYDLMHWRRSLEEKEALIRDISCRSALGLPLEEPGRYDIETVFSKGRYDPTNPLYRYDYWGEPKTSEKSKNKRRAEERNQAIVGPGEVWYGMSYEEVIKQKMHREAEMKKMPGDDDEEEEEEEEDDDDDYIHSLLCNSDSHSTGTLLVNGAEFPGTSDEDILDEN